MDRKVIDHALELPFRRFSRDEWAQLRADTQLTLTIDDLRKLQSTHDPISLDEVVAIYLPLSRLLALYVAATQGLFKATSGSWARRTARCPTSLAWPARSRSGSRQRRACCRRC